EDDASQFVLEEILAGYEDVRLNQFPGVARDVLPIDVPDGHALGLAGWSDGRQAVYSFKLCSESDPTVLPVKTTQLETYDNVHSINLDRIDVRERNFRAEGVRLV